MKKIAIARVWLHDALSLGSGYEIYSVNDYDMAQHGWYEVGQFSIEFEEPTREQAVPKAVEGLREGLTQIRAAAEVRCREVEEQIQNLLSLTYKPEDYIPF